MHLLNVMATQCLHRLPDAAPEHYSSTLASFAKVRPCAAAAAGSLAAFAAVTRCLGPSRRMATAVTHALRAPRSPTQTPLCPPSPPKQLTYLPATPVLAGAAGPTAIARWAGLKKEFLTGILDLPHGIPGKDVFRRDLMMLKPEAFEAAFYAWIEASAAHAARRAAASWHSSS